MDSEQSDRSADGETPVEPGLLDPPRSGSPFDRGRLGATFEWKRPKFRSGSDDAGSESGATDPVDQDAAPLASSALAERPQSEPAFAAEQSDGTADAEQVSSQPAAVPSTGLTVEAAMPGRPVENAPLDEHWILDEQIAPPSPPVSAHDSVQLDEVTADDADELDGAGDPVSSTEVAEVAESTDDLSPLDEVAADDATEVDGVEDSVPPVEVADLAIAADDPVQLNVVTTDDVVQLDEVEDSVPPVEVAELGLLANDLSPLGEVTADDADELDGSEDPVSPVQVVEFALPADDSVQPEEFVADDAQALPEAPDSVPWVEVAEVAVPAGDPVQSDEVTADQAEELGGAWDPDPLAEAVEVPGPIGGDGVGWFSPPVSADDPVPPDDVTANEVADDGPGYSVPLVEAVEAPGPISAPVDDPVQPGDVDAEELAAVKIEVDDPGGLDEVTAEVADRVEPIEVEAAGTLPMVDWGPVDDDDLDEAGESAEAEPPEHDDTPDDTDTDAETNTDTDDTEILEVVDIEALVVEGPIDETLDDDEATETPSETHHQDQDETEELPTMEDLRAMAADLDEVDAILERLDDDPEGLADELNLDRPDEPAAVTAGDR